MAKENVPFERLLNKLSRSYGPELKDIYEKGSAVCGKVDEGLPERFDSSAKFMFDQYDQLREYSAIGKNKMGMMRCAAAYLNELSNLSQAFRRFPDNYTPGELEGVVSDLLKIGVSQFEQMRLDRMVEYPRTLEEFYIKYA